MPDIRPATIYVSSKAASGAETAAKLLGYDCADAWIDSTIRDALSKIPAIEEFTREFAKAAAAVRKAWEAKHIRPDSPFEP